MSAPTPDPNTRDHLANERTFLAWVRTAIALVSFGVVIARLRFLVPAAPAHTGSGVHSTQLGIAFAAVGLGTLVFATVHYEAMRRAIITGSYQSSGRIVIAFAVVVLALGVVSLLYLLTLVPH